MGNAKIFWMGTLHCILNSCSNPSSDCMGIGEYASMKHLYYSPSVPEQEVGECYLLKSGNITEIVQADEYINIASEVFFLPLYADTIARDGKLVMIKGFSTYAWYEIVDQSYMRDLWICKLIKKEILSHED